MKIDFKLNNEAVSIDTDPQQRLLDVLRNDFGLTSMKEGCGEGECGACTVLLDSRSVASCILPAAMVHGRHVETLEGVRKIPSFKVINRAFAISGAVQCGFCTPGMVMATEALLRKNPTPSGEEVREAISGNLCRCTGYQMIIEGIKQVAENKEEL